MTHTRTNDDRAAALLSRGRTPQLAQALRTLDAQPPSREGNWARAQLIQELERRFPAAAAAVEAAFEQADHDGTHVDYVAVLLAAIPV